MDGFPERSNIINGSNYRENLLSQLKDSLENADPNSWEDTRRIEINEVEKQKEFFWIRIYLKEEDTDLEKGDPMTISYKPTNESLEMVFGSYEKEGLNRDHDDEVINYVDKDNKKILCCMIDLNRINKESDDIPTIRTFFRNSRYYQEELYYKSDIIISSKDKEYEYSSIAF